MSCPIDERRSFPRSGSDLWDIEALQRRLSTPLITKRHLDYDQARRVYNRWHDARPGAIVRTQDIGDLRRVLEFAATYDIELAVRGGGHHIGGFGTSEGGIVVDFSTFRNVALDTSRCYAIAQPGVRLGDMDRATSAVGMVVPTGTVSDTGIAGLTLGGGIGWLIGRYGLTCDHLIGADVLLPDGRLVKAEDRDHEILLWALRGGGGNFGIVLNFRYALRALPPTYCGSLVVSWKHARSALKRTVDYLAAHCPSSITVAPVLLMAENRPYLSIDFCCTAPDAEATLTPLFREVGEAEARNCRAWSFPEWQRNFDGAFLPAMRGYWKARYTRSIASSTIATLCDVFESAPSSRCSILVEHLHGAIKLRGSDFAAFPHRNVNFGVLLSARWEEPADDQRTVEWLKEAYSAAFPDDGAGSYLNYTMPGGLDTTRQVIGSSFERLREAKHRYDPGNILRRNHNLSALS